MEKSHTLLLIENDITVMDKYVTLLSEYFTTIIQAHNEKEALSKYLHYQPDAVIVGSGVLNNYYKEFLDKVKKTTVPIILMVQPSQVNGLLEVFNYNFMYCIMDENAKVNLQNCASQAVQKIELVKHLSTVDATGNIKTLERYEESLEKSSIPTIICTGNIDDVYCNSAFRDCFGVTQDEVNKHVLTQDFLNRLDLKHIIAKKDLTKEHDIVINDISLKSKIYILEQYELYLITFNSISNENRVINMSLKKELEQILERIDNNFEDHFKHQYNMIQVSSQIREFLQTDTPDEIIHKWLEHNHTVLQAIEREFDYVIVEELKMHSYLCVA